MEADLANAANSDGQDVGPERRRDQLNWSVAARMFGPAYLVAVGYMDPGNWATDLAAGSRYGYGLLWVVAVSSGMAMVLQSLSCRLGIATGWDLAQACRRLLPDAWRIPLWLLAEVAIVACDLAELVGSAIALQLLFGLPLPWGVALTAGDTLLLLALQHFGVRRLEALIIALVALVGACFAWELLLLKPDWLQVAAGFLPQPSVLRDGQQLYIAAGILGATVMPHNLYLHSALVNTRRWPEHPPTKPLLLRLASLDSVMALSFAFLVNAAILILAAGAFHGVVAEPVEDLRQAYTLLSPLLGSTLAGTVFAVALLAAGQSSTVTATMAGQVVMEGFLNLRLPDWQRRLITRALALIPAMATVILLGDQATAHLLVLSQVVLSLQLPFAVIPLVQFCTRRGLMGELRAPGWLQGLSWLCAAAIVIVNVSLLSTVLASFRPWQWLTAIASHG
ncbi:MAG: divalent metal cation transporter [Synechococcaceae bacterium WBA_2_066]|jgi:manganese transport protein|nr:divalent metal cation transporter [Synechococcaceae bacterium WB6_1A_059]NBP33372.1 divalent metal cation transporter [Synechococcaceae bacterium WB6_1B_055]NBQ18311.1 divalent metal cation transporter [Synechococcaceae bacterium WB5_2A_257]NBR43690.1 divalent metal cation transporter [Synechococcaceae bacterium WB5_2B_268]NBS92473.1 divalent metal cation transporter [Betaproteobacteria bacterium]NBY59167.1 divalent metal cation transporter [Synechococcaceae bacterium LLD_019]NCU76900.1 di